MNRVQEKAFMAIVNKILQQGINIKTEKISYKWYQSVHGKSVVFRASGKFLELLLRKDANAGGKVEDINTHETKLSQVCPVRGVETLSSTLFPNLS